MQTIQKIHHAYGDKRIGLPCIGGAVTVNSTTGAVGDVGGTGMVFILEFLA
jgi:hypothetical protein